MQNAVLISANHERAQRISSHFVREGVGLLILPWNAGSAQRVRNADPRLIYVDDRDGVFETDAVIEQLRDAGTSSVPVVAIGARSMLADVSLTGSPDVYDLLDAGETLVDFGGSNDDFVFHAADSNEDSEPIDLLSPVEDIDPEDSGLLFAADPSHRHSGQHAAVSREPRRRSSGQHPAATTPQQTEYQSRISALSMELARVASERERAFEHLSQLRVTLEGLRKENQSAAGQLQKLREELEQRDAQAQTLSSSAQNADTELEAAVRRAEDAESAHAHAAREHELEAGKLRKELREGNSRLDEARAALADLRVVTDQAMLELRQKHEADTASADKMHAEIVGRLEAAEAENSALRAGKAELQKASDEKDAKLELIEKSLQELREQSENLTAERDAAMNENETLTGTIEELQNSKSQLEARVEQIESEAATEKEALTGQLEAMLAEHESQATRISAAGDVIVAAEAAVDAAQKARKERAAWSASLSNALAQRNEAVALIKECLSTAMEAIEQTDSETTPPPVAADADEKLDTFDTELAGYRDDVRP